MDFEPTPADAWLRLTALSLTVDDGRIANDRDGVKIGQTIVTREELLAQGVKKLVNAEFARDPDGFRANPSFEYRYLERRQTRFVAAGSVTSKAAPLAGDDEGAYSADFELRCYLGDRPQLTTRSSFEIKMKFSQPVLGRMTVGPFFNWYRVWAGLPQPFTQREFGFEIQLPAFGAAGLGRVLR